MTIRYIQDGSAYTALHIQKRDARIIPKHYAQVIT